MSKGFLLASVWGVVMAQLNHCLTRVGTRPRHNCQGLLNTLYLSYSLTVILIFHCLSFTRTGFDHLSLFTSVHLAFTAFTLRELSTHFWS